MAKDSPASGFGAIVAAAGSAALFLVSWFALAVPLPFSLGVGVVGYVALWFVGRELGERLFPAERPLDTNFVDKELAAKTAAFGHEQSARLRGLCAGLGRDDPTAPRFARIASLMEAIAKDVETDPKDAPAARTFLAYYAESACRLAVLVAGMRGRGASKAQLEDADARLEVSLARLVKSFENHLAHLQEDNLAELQAELDVLEQSMGIDGGEFETLALDAIEAEKAKRKGEGKAQAGK